MERFHNQTQRESLSDSWSLGCLPSNSESSVRIFFPKVGHRNLDCAICLPFLPWNLSFKRCPVPYLGRKKIFRTGKKDLNIQSLLAFPKSVYYHHNTIIFLTFYLSLISKAELQRERRQNKERCWINWFTPQISIISRVRPGACQEPERPVSVSCE